MSVYVLTHKKYQKFTDSTYRDLLVGAYRGHIYGDCFDDAGENISEKNANYCELTGLYWLWKHCNDDYIGLVHYRRYFTHRFCGRHVLSDQEIRSLLKENDIILPFRHQINATVEKQYCRNSGLKKDLERVDRILSEKYPDYVQTYRAFLKSDRIYFFNMMILDREKFNAYCSWLFDILFTLEQQVDLSEYNDYQKRIFGFLSERLLNVWVLKNRLKVKEVGVFNTEEKIPFKKRFLMALKRSLKYREPGREVEAGASVGNQGGDP
jgi:hypothetical protein